MSLTSSILDCCGQHSHNPQTANIQYRCLLHQVSADSGRRFQVTPAIFHTEHLIAAILAHELSCRRECKVDGGTGCLTLWPHR